MVGLRRDTTALPKEAPRAGASFHLACEGVFANTKVDQ